MPKRRYSDQERAAALATLDANSGDVRRTARQVGVPEKTLAEWRDGRHHPDVANLRGEKKAGLADRFEDVVHKILDVVPGKIADAGLAQLMTAAGIGVDKMLLLRKDQDGA